MHVQYAIDLLWSLPAQHPLSLLVVTMLPPIASGLGGTTHQRGPSRSAIGKRVQGPQTVRRF